MPSSKFLRTLQLLKLIFDYNAAIISNSSCSYLNFFATCTLLIFAKVWLLFDALSWYVNVDNVPWYHSSVPQVLSVIILITSMELPCSYLALWTELQAAQANLNTQHNFITKFNFLIEHWNTKHRNWKRSRDIASI